MEIISYIMAGYLAGAALTGIRLGWHLIFRLDKFDWQYSKFQIWVSFVVSTLLWPLMLLKPKNLFDPKDLFNPTDSFELNHLMATRMREESRWWNNPPPCGAQILYRQSDDVFGEFTFHSDDIEKFLVDKLNEHPHLENDHEGVILNWLRQRDDTITEPSVVPKAWSRFEIVADDVLRNGVGKARCLMCNKPFPLSEILQKDERGRRSRHTNRLTCPNDHHLLEVTTMYINYR